MAIAEKRSKKQHDPSQPVTIAHSIHPAIHIIHLFHAVKQVHYALQAEFTLSSSSSYHHNILLL